MRLRITRLAVVVATVAVVLFAVPLAAIAFAYVLDDERAELVRAADGAAVTAAAQLSAGRAVTTLIGRGQDPSARLALYDGAGRLVFGSGPALADPVVRAAATDGIDESRTSGDVSGDLVVAVAVTDSDSFRGESSPGNPARIAPGTPPMTVRAATTRWEVYRPLALVGIGMVVLGVLATVTAWILSRRLARRLTRPLEELSHAARRLGDGDFTARGPLVGVAEIDAVTRALADTADRIDQVLARERAFSADASHQLRTPLAGLRLGLEAALETPDADPRPAMLAAIRAADRLHTTVEDLLDLARDTHRGGEPLDLDQLLTETADAWRAPLAAAGRRLALRRTDDAPSTSASTGAVRQILTVLLDNALAHGSGQITLTARDATGALALDVTDEGSGVARQEQLFTRRDAGAAGRGIGLALARNLAEAEGGRLVLARPAPPTFSLLLPGHDRPAAGRR